MYSSVKGIPQIHKAKKLSRTSGFQKKNLWRANIYFLYFFKQWHKRELNFFYFII